MKINETTLCVVYEQPHAARAAWEALQRSNLERPLDVTIHHGGVDQSEYTVTQSRSGFGALAGALIIGIPTSIFLGAMASLGLLASLGIGMATVIGLVSGALLGALTGGIIGATEPTRLLADVRESVRQGQVALVARFHNRAQVRSAYRLLATQPGAMVPAPIGPTAS